jgi:uncharacterized protein YjbJ (UPF0337 family)
MDKRRVKGKVADAVGRAKRQVEEWTNETKARVKNATRKVKNKAEHGLDKIKHAAHDAKEKATGRASAAKPGRETKLHKDSEALEDSTKPPIDGSDVSINLLYRVEEPSWIMVARGYVTD